MVNSPTEAALPVLAVRAGPHLCAVPLDRVAEVMRPLPVESLAGAAPCVLGLAMIRGGATPVIDLAALLSDRPAARPTGTGRFVALQVGSRRVALSVETVLAIRMLDRTELESLPPLWRGPHPPAVAALGALDRELLMVLEAARVFPDDHGPSADEGGLR